ncbi:MAG: ribosomal protein S18-alanine N-acetyltransferase [Vibrionaceae bacterium]
MQLVNVSDVIEQVVAIEQQAHAFPWSDALLTKVAGRFDCNKALLHEGQVVGYFFAQIVAGEASLLNFAIAPRWQRQGLGQKLLELFLQQARLLGAEQAWLEVRQSNSRAIALYELAGFNEIDRRYGYYPTLDGKKEDALVMSYWFEPECDASL